MRNLGCLHPRQLPREGPCDGRQGRSFTVQRQSETFNSANKVFAKTHSGRLGFSFPVQTAAAQAALFAGAIGAGAAICRRVFIIRVETIGNKFKHIADNIIKPEPVWLIHANNAGITRMVDTVIEPTGKINVASIAATLQDILTRQICRIGIAANFRAVGVIAKMELCARARQCGIFPFGFGWQAVRPACLSSQPFCVGICGFPADAHNRLKLVCGWVISRPCKIHAAANSTNGTAAAGL